MGVTMTEYYRDLPVKTAFPPMEVVNGLAETISKKGLRQYHIAESEKYAHISVFFNGGVSNPFPREERNIVTSPATKYTNYLDMPVMYALQVTEEIFMNPS